MQARLQEDQSLESHEKECQKYIDLIMDMNRKGMTCPENILYALLEGYLKDNVQQYENTHFFRKRRKIDSPAFIQKLIKLKSYPESQDYVLTVIRHLKANHEDLDETQGLTILLGSFFSIYEVYRPYLSSEVENKLAFREIWNEMISLWINDARKDKESAKKLLSHMSAWVPLEIRRSLLEIEMPGVEFLISEIEDENRRFYIGERLPSFMDVLTNNERERVINALLNLNVESEDFYELLHTLKNWVGLEQRNLIVDRLMKLTFATSANQPGISFFHREDIPKFKEWLSVGNRQEIVNFWFAQTYDERAYVREYSFRNLDKCENDIPDEKIDSLIDRSIICADDVSHDVRRSVFAILCRFKNRIPLEKHDEIVCLYLKNLIDEDIFLDYAYGDILRECVTSRNADIYTDRLSKSLLTLASLSSSYSGILPFLQDKYNEIINMHESLFRENMIVDASSEILSTLLSSNQKINNHVQSVIYMIYPKIMNILLAIREITKFFTKEQLAALVEGLMKSLDCLDHIQDVDKRFHGKEKLIEAIIRLSDDDTPSCLRIILMEKILNYLEKKQNNPEDFLTFVWILYLSKVYAGVLTDTNRNQFIEYMLEHMHNGITFKMGEVSITLNDVPTKLAFFQSLYNCIKYMSDNQKLSFSREIFSCIDAMLFACENYSLYPIFDKLLQCVIKTMSDSQYANISKQLLELQASDQLIRFLNATQNLNQKTALLCKLAQTASGNDNAQMKNLFIGVYVSYQQELARILISKAANQEHKDLPDEMLERIMSYTL